MNNKASFFESNDALFEKPFEDKDKKVSTSEPENFDNNKKGRTFQD